VLLAIIPDQTRPANLRKSAIAIAARCPAAVVADPLAAGTWSPAAEDDWDIAFQGSNLLGMSLGQAGFYARLRPRLAKGSRVAAVEIIHPNDVPLLLEDLDQQIGEICAVILGEKRESSPNAPYTGAEIVDPLTLAGALRLGREAPATAADWAGRLDAVFEHSPPGGVLQNFAYSLLPALAQSDPAAAGTYLGRLLDRHIEAVAHTTKEEVIEHLRIKRAFSLPSHPLIDVQLERLIRCCADDEGLALAAEAALEGRRGDWLADFLRRESASGRPGRVARARYLAALAGLPTDSFAGRGFAFLDAVEAQAAVLERNRETFHATLDRWRQAPSRAERLAAEIALFDSLLGFAVDIPPSLGHGEDGVLLSVRLAFAQSEARSGLSQTLFGWAAPPAWIVFANVPPRLAARTKDQDQH